MEHLSSPAKIKYKFIKSLSTEVNSYSLIRFKYYFKHLFTFCNVSQEPPMLRESAISAPELNTSTLRRRQAEDEAGATSFGKNGYVSAHNPMPIGLGKVTIFLPIRFLSSLKFFLINRISTIPVRFCIKSSIGCKLLCMLCYTMRRTFTLLIYLSVLST